MRLSVKSRDSRCARLVGFALGTLAAGLIVGGCGGDRPAGPSEEPPRNVRVLALRPMALDEYWEIAGPVRPVRGTDVSAEESGTVATVLRDKGARVKAGDVLLELDRRLLRAELEAARSGLAHQEYTVDKTRQLHDAGKVSRQELLAMEAQFEQAKAQARIAELRYERAAVKAPFAGVVADRYVEPGQLVTPGLPVARVVDLYTLKLEGYLTEREIGWVAADAPAEVTLDGVDRPLSARVHWVGAEASPKNGKFPVEIRIANAELSVPVGAVGRARVLKNLHPEALALPRDAVVSLGAGPTVFVVESDTARAVPITLGPDQGLMVIVTEGLRAGDRVVVRGQRDLLSGSRVRVTSEAASPDGSAPGDPGVVEPEAPATTAPAAAGPAGATGSVAGGGGDSR